MSRKEMLEALQKCRAVSKPDTTTIEPEFLERAAQALYDALDSREIIGRIATHQLFEGEIKVILAQHLKAFLVEHWPHTQQL